MTRREEAVFGYMREAIGAHDDMDGAMRHLAVWIANLTADNRDGADPPLVEAYRRVRAEAEAAAL